MKIVKDGVYSYKCCICKESFSVEGDLHKHLNHHVNEVHSSDCGPIDEEAIPDQTSSSNTIEELEDEENYNEVKIYSISTACIANTTTTSTAKISRAKLYKCRECFKSFAIK